MQLRLSMLAILSLAGCKESNKTDTPSKSHKTNSEKPKSGEISNKAPDAPTKTHSNGMERFKDPGVYVDGKMLGVLRFGELPVPLEPYWYEEKAALPFKPGSTGPRHKIVKQRRYRFSDYFRGMGLKLEDINEVHIYGGNRKAAAVVIPGESIRKFDDFVFRFGGAIWGKPIPACPPKVGDGKCPDQIGSIAVYMKLTPPERRGGYFYMDGKRLEGIPYYGEPSRGGVRIYMDGPLAAIIKRNRLKAGELKSDAQGRYRFVDFLKSQGVDVSKVQELWLVEYERRTKKISREEILSATFSAGEAGSGEILFGDERTPAHAISMHSKKLSIDDLPKLLPDELEKADG